MSTPQNDAFRILAPKPIDSRYLKNEITPWASVSEVNTAINSAYRYVGLTVLIGTVEYWYLGDVTDGSLIPKNPQTSITLNLTNDGFYQFATTSLVVALVVVPNIAINFKAGSSAGAEDFVPTMTLDANVPAGIAVFLVRNTGQRIYFGGIAGSNTSITIKTL